MRGKPVTVQEIDRIEALRLQGLTIYEIAERLSRASSFVYGRIKSLGLQSCLDRSGSGKKAWEMRRKKYGRSGCSPEGLQKKIRQCRQQFSGERNPSHRADVRRKISMAQKGVPCPQRGRKGKVISLSQRKRLSENAKKRFADPRNHPLYGKPRSEELKEKQRKAMIGRKHIEKHNQKISKGLLESEKFHKAMSSEKRIEKIKQKVSKIWQQPEFREKMKQIQTSPEYRKAISDGLVRKAKEDSTFHERRIKASTKTLHERPNQSELKLNTLLQQLFTNEYKYVGDGSFIIAGKCPDFVNVNGKKKIVELFGVVFHNPEKAFFEVPYEQTEDGRVKLFKKYGFDTLIVWDSELDNVPMLSEKLMRFHNGDEV